MESEVKKSKHIPRSRAVQRYRQKISASEHKASERFAFQVCVCIILIAMLMVISHIKQFEYISSDLKYAVSTDMSEKQAAYIKDKVEIIVGKIIKSKNKKAVDSPKTENTNKENVQNEKGSVTETNTDTSNSIENTTDNNEADSKDDNADMSTKSTMNSMWYIPLKGIISSFFGERLNPTSNAESAQFHEGIDIAAEINTCVYAARSGTVKFSGFSKTYGNEIKIDTDDGYETLYAHLNKACVKDGDKVKTGQLIAYSGNTGDSTGPHLHFAVYKDATAEDPLDFYNKNDFEK